MSIPHFQQFIFLFFSISFSSFVHSADLEAGKNKAAVCQGCHGEKGISKNSQYPSLAGQRANYLEYQLVAFQAGKRTSPVMQGMVANLDRQDMKNISAYFSSLTPESAGSDSGMAKKGKNKVAMCLGCHGSNAEGRGGFPRLAGQHPEYLKKQLLNFKSGARTGGPMKSMTSSLSEQDIDEISAYLGSL